MKVFSSSTFVGLSVAPGPVYVVVHVVGVHPQAGHVVDGGGGGGVPPLVPALHRLQPRLQELRDVQDDGGQHGRQ